MVSGSPVIHSETFAVDASEPAAARRIMSRSVRMPIARSSWSITTTEPTLPSLIRCAATATVSAGCAVTTGVDMTSATVRSRGTAGVEASLIGAKLRSSGRIAVATGAPREPDGAVERLARRKGGLRVSQLDAHRVILR